MFVSDCIAAEECVGLVTEFVSLVIVPIPETFAAFWTKTESLSQLLYVRRQHRHVQSDTGPIVKNFNRF